MTFFFRKTIGSNNSFTRIKKTKQNKTKQVFKIAKFEFKVTAHCSLWAKCTQMWPLKCTFLHYSCHDSKSFFRSAFQITFVRLHDISPRNITWFLSDISLSLCCCCCCSRPSLCVGLCLPAAEVIELCFTRIYKECPLRRTFDPLRCTSAAS